MASEETQRIEPHYTVPEIAKQWKLSDDTVRNMFVDEEGVLKIGQPTRLVNRRVGYKRRYSVLRIPESVFQRVRDRLVNKRAGPVGGIVVVGRDRDLHAG
jgi:hypothetical protein